MKLFVALPVTEGDTVPDVVPLTVGLGLEEVDDDPDKDAVALTVVVTVPDAEGLLLAEALKDDEGV